MKGLLKLFVVELKLFLREPQAAFFTLVFPLMMLFIFGSIYGNEPSTFFGGFGSVDVSVPAYTALIIATSGLLSLPIVIVVYREYGILRRFRATPLHPLNILVAQVGVIFLMTALGMILLVIAGKLVYNLRFAGNPINIVIAFIISSFSFFSLGFIFASVLPTMRTSQTITMALYFPMIFLSGATIPREVFPANIQKYAEILPLTHIVNLLRGLWIGNSWNQHLKEVGILAMLFVLGIIISAKTFRWE